MADSSLFVHKHGSIVIYLLIYVDDILITGNNPNCITQLTQDMSRRFSMKDLGSLHYFLGTEVYGSTNGMHLSQSKYILDLLTRTNMLDCKPVSTPSIAGK